MSLFKIKHLLFKISTSTRRKFYSDFAMALSDGIDAKSRLEKLHKIAVRSNSWKASVYATWLVRFKRMGYVEAMKVSIPVNEYMILRAAEYKGGVAESMNLIADSLEIKEKIAAAYVASFISPIIALIAIVSSVYTFVYLTAPSNIEALPLNKWPALSKNLYLVCTAVTDNLTIFCILIGIGISVVLWSRDKWTGRLRSFFDRLPFLPWKSYKVKEGDAFLLSLALMLQTNSIGIKGALELLRSNSSSWLIYQINMMLRRYELNPEVPAAALDVGMFDRETIDRIVDISERSGFNYSLQKLALENTNQKVSKAQREAAISAFAAIVFSALIVLLFAGANFEFNGALQQFVRSMK